MSVGHWQKDRDGETKILREKPVPVPLRPTQIPRGIEATVRRQSEPWHPSTFILPILMSYPQHPSYFNSIILAICMNDSTILDS
jgi:hypothetical protein